MLGLEQFVAAQLCTRDGLISARQWAMGEEVRSIAQPANASMKIPRRSMQYWSGSIVVAAIFIAFLAIGGHLGTVNVRYLFDDHDIGVYFRSSRWIVEGSILYNDVFSEYPLLANAIFAAIRYVTEATFPGNLGFQYLWVLMAGVIYALATIRVATFASLLSAAIWLAPASIYFALFRYDIYPAVATLFGLFAIRRESYMAGAIWFGVAIALKGYALFMVPALWVFVFYRRGPVVAVCVGIVAIVPMIASLAVIYGFAGWEGVTAPFRFHLGRGFNRELTYDALNYVLGTRLQAEHIPFVSPALQALASLAAAAMRPRSFDDLVNAMTFAIIGYVTFSVFYSPQFILWLLPTVCFAKSRMMAVLALLLAWLTYMYFPVAWDLANMGASSEPLHALIVVVTALRVSMMVVAVRIIHRC